VLLLAGDLTRGGNVDEAAVLAEELDGVACQSSRCSAITTTTVIRNVRPLPCSPTTASGCWRGKPQSWTLRGTAGGCRDEGLLRRLRRRLRRGVRRARNESVHPHTKRVAEGLEQALSSLDAACRVALLHFAPATLRGEWLEIYPFLGSYLLTEACDRAGADLIIHGHAHAGSEKGMTAGGIPVRNVAQPVIATLTGSTV
jgi:hypothetical protein